MSIMIETGKKSDIEEIAQLYDDLNDSLASGINYPGWRKGVYPTRQDAIEGIANESLYVVKQFGEIVASVILCHDPEPAYHKVKWGIDVPYSDVFVIRTFAVHPAYQNNGIGRSVMEFIVQQSIAEHIKSIRLDVYENNLPAIRLYEKSGFRYIDTVDLGLGCYGLNYFKLYEKLL